MSSSANSPGLPTVTSWPRRGPGPGSGQGGEPDDLRQAAEPGGGRPGDGLADRVLRAVFDGLASSSASRRGFPGVPPGKG